MPGVSGYCVMAPAFATNLVQLMSTNPLGESIPNPSKYDPGILYPIPRWSARSLLDIDKKLRMYGFDHWRAYELSWLNQKGKPIVAMGEFYFDVDSENILESKSLKLYLNSLNLERFSDSSELTGVIANDLSALSKSEVKIRIHGPESNELATNQIKEGRLLDSLDVEISAESPEQALLQKSDEVVFDESVRTELFRSNCPVTGAPDWASVVIRYTGNKISEPELLHYLCSFRHHQGYHEECAERIYRDIMLRCEPDELFVAMNYLRRGGIEINVYRCSAPIPVDVANPRLIRQ